MADRKDNTPGDKEKKPALSTSSTDKPLDNSDQRDDALDIDTSHLSVDESTDNTGSLESSKPEETADIDVSHLSLGDDATPDQPASAADDFDLHDDLPEQAAESPPADEAPAPESEDTDIAPSSPRPPAEGTGNLVINNPLARKPGEQDSSRINNASDKQAAGKEADEPEKVMLKSSQPDTSFDEEFNADDIPGDPADEDENAEETGPIDVILDTVKKPETIVQNAWSNSSARQYLLDNVESFRKKDEDQNMEAVIENVYGGAAEGKLSPGRFIKENILFSFLIFLLIFLVGWKVAGIVFPEQMPAINDRIIKTVEQSVTSKPKKKKESKKTPVVVNETNQTVIQNTLSHCLVLPEANEQLISMFSLNGFNFKKGPLTSSYDEISDSIRFWNGMNMDFYIEDAILRHRELEKLALPVIDEAILAVSAYRDAIKSLADEAASLEAEIRNIQTSKGNQSTATINQRIPLRNKLNKINLRLEQEPGIERFDEMLANLKATKTSIDNQNVDRLTPDELTRKDPAWLVPISETESGNIGDLIIKDVLPPIQNQSAKLTSSSPKLTGYHLSELNIAVENLAKLSSLISYLPENMLLPYELELNGLTRRLNELMKKKNTAWMSVDQCLIDKRAEVMAAGQ